MSHSKSSGLGHPPVPHRRCILRGPGHFAMLGESWLAVSVGVGHNEDTLPSVWGAADSGRNSVGTGSIPKASETFPNLREPPSGAALDVLDHDDVRLDRSDDPLELVPETTLFTLEPTIPPTSRLRHILTREPAADEIYRRPLEASHVLVPRNLRPVLLQDAPAKRTDLDLPYDLTKPRPLEAKLQAADAAEQ